MEKKLSVAEKNNRDVATAAETKEAVYQNSNFHLIIVCYGKDAQGKETGIEQDYASDFIDGENLKVPSNVTIIFSTFKDFVEAYPFNFSYSEPSIQSYASF